ncbi:hypothetical protein CDO73_09005 [Saccharibacillus sp. O23]|uniref:S-layer homology domain-containing protein n=1 Tax=Saccharibacillus sp. O23 TaxID=2009338 RepID=UPI000B4E27D0|nr:S-layer homology domain-containing protein [Saccharibacillus sp. O23]OWR30723.1 hypothetical protein CDO73_09005 [Saccharibacillus sp. O23]
MIKILRLFGNKRWMRGTLASILAVGLIANAGIAPAKADGGSELVSLGLSAGNLTTPFDPYESEYYVSVSDETQVLYLQPEAGNSDSVITVNNDAGVNGVYTVTLDQDETQIDIVSEIDLEDYYSQSPYTLHVIKEGSNLLSPKLKSLSLEEGNPTLVFDENEIDYYTEVSYDVTELHLDAEAYSRNASLTVKVNGDDFASATPSVIPFPLSESDISISVEVDVPGTNAGYMYGIVVEREDPSLKDDRLSKLELEEADFDIPFDSDEQLYSAVVSRDASVLHLTVESISPNAGIEAKELFGDFDERSLESYLVSQDGKIRYYEIPFGLSQEYMDIRIDIDVPEANGGRGYGIMIEREDPSLKDDRLSKLKLEEADFDIPFDSDEQLYSAVVSRDAKVLHLAVESISPNAVIEAKELFGDLEERSLESYLVSQDGKLRYYEIPFGLSEEYMDIRIDIDVPESNGGRGYGIMIERKAPSGGNDGGGTSPEPNPPVTNPAPVTTVPDTAPANPPAAPTGVSVLVNGKSETAGTLTKTISNNRSSAVIAVDPAKLTSRLNEESAGAVITLPFAENADALTGSLTGQMVQAMTDKQAILKIQTPNASYTLPAAQIDVSRLAQQLGSAADLSKLDVRISIVAPNAETLARVTDGANREGLTVLGSPVDFRVEGVYGGRTVEVDRFDAYMERSLVLPAGIDPNRITTGVTVDADGTVRHVPTRVVRSGGVYSAVINSLTNSTYAVVWHPVRFADVTKHWSENAVNDLGSRLIVEGTGSGAFEPNRGVTRDEFAATLVRALGLKPLKEVSETSGASASERKAREMQAARDYGILQENGGGTSAPDAPISREQAAVMLASAMKIAGLAADSGANALSVYRDAQSVSAWAQADLNAAVQAGLLNGRGGGKLAPQEQVLRAEVAQMVQRLLQRSGLI